MRVFQANRRRAALPSLLSLFSTLCWSAPVAPGPMQPVDPTLPELRIQISVVNLTGPAEAGRLPISTLGALVDSANRIWAQCAVSFIPKSIANVDAAELGAPYPPRSEQDLSSIARALNPHGFGHAIPFTVAGPWRFFDPVYQLYLNGLGWEFTRPQGVERIGAMMSSLKVPDTEGPAIAAHELGHTLGLSHVKDGDNLLGGSTRNRLTIDQCQQARRFAGASLRDFLL